MQSASYPKYNNYADALAQKRKKLIIRKVVLSASIGIILATIASYLLFFTPYFQIESFSFSGLRTVDQKEIEPTLDSIINENTFKILESLQIQQQKNILFFNTETLKERILAQFPVIKSLTISKDYFHKVNLELAERIPIGSVCFTDHDSISCRYFDEEGVLWGQALKSSGSLLLNINDLRLGQENALRIESSLIEPILKVIKSLDDLEIRILRVEIPQSSIGDFKIHTPMGYYFLFNHESDILKQMEVLKIFLDNKGADFLPEYIDLRIEGRVYYK